MLRTSILLLLFFTIFGQQGEKLTLGKATDMKTLDESKSDSYYVEIPPNVVENTQFLVFDVPASQILTKSYPLHPEEHRISWRKRLFRPGCLHFNRIVSLYYPFRRQWLSQHSSTIISVARPMERTSVYSRRNPSSLTRRFMQVSRVVRLFSRILLEALQIQYKSHARIRVWGFGWWSFGGSYRKSWN